MLCDGMADEPLEELKGQTPLEAAKTPCMDRMAVCSEIGMVRTVPENMAPGSDTANLSVMGYDPDTLYRTVAVRGAEYRCGYEAGRCFLSMQSGDII